MRSSEFARYLESLENTSSRLQMDEVLGTLFDKADEEELRHTKYSPR